MRSAKADASPVVRAGVGRLPARRIVVLTAAVGEGHLAAARVLAADLRAGPRRVDVTVVDVLPIFGWALRLILRDLYRLQLRAAPWMFGVLFFLFLRVRLLRRCGRAGLALLASRSLARTLRACRPDIVVSTYPAATSVLGTLRQRGTVAVPVCATITDFAAIPF